MTTIDVERTACAPAHRLRGSLVEGGDPRVAPVGRTAPDGYRRARAAGMPAGVATANPSPESFRSPVPGVPTPVPREALTA